MHSLQNNPFNPFIAAKTVENAQKPIFKGHPIPRGPRNVYDVDYSQNIAQKPFFNPEPEQQYVSMKEFLALKE